MIYFIHIPKTAGTTLIRIMDRQMYFSRFKRINPTRDEHPKTFLNNYGKVIANMGKKQLNKLDVVGGHFNFGIHNVLNDNTPSYITFLRNPVERVISEYYFMKQKGFYYQKLIQEEQLNLQEYLYHPETFYLNNLQTRMISGVSFKEGDQVNEDVYQLAIENLKSFVIAGLTEKFLDSLALIYLKLEWKRKPIFINFNVNEERPDLQPNNEILSQIRKRELFDIRLYEEGKKLFLSELNKNVSAVSNIKNDIMHPPGYYQHYMQGLYAWNRIKDKLKSSVYNNK